MCQICLLEIIIICQFLTGMTVADVTVFSSSGDSVSLPCNNALSDCTSTTWNHNYNKYSETVELIAGGIKKNIGRHERLSLGSDCSLNIKKVTHEDYGLYTCRQYVNGQQQGTNARVNLHVLRISSSSSQTEIRSGSVTLSCQLYSDGVSCNHLLHSKGFQLIWVNQAGVNLKMTDSRYQISFSTPHCISSMTTTLLNEDPNREFRCQVTQRNQLKTSATYTVKISAPVDSTTLTTVSNSNSEKKSSRTTAALTQGNSAEVFRSSGESVSLPCNNALSDCTSTTWNYNKDSQTVELISGGIKKNIGRHERLSLGSDCSLNIKKVTHEDYGLYTCRQYVNGQQQGNDARVNLHVLRISSLSSQTEIRSGSVTLFCQLYSDGVSCHPLVRSEGLQLIWVNQAGVNLMSDSRYQISFSTPHCISSMTTRLLNEDPNREFRCQVTQSNQLKTSATYTVKFSAPVDSTTLTTVSNSNSEKKSSRTTAAAALTQGPANTISDNEVCMAAGSIFREIVNIFKIAAFTAPTVILLQIICARRAGRKDSHHPEEIEMPTVLE